MLVFEFILENVDFANCIIYLENDTLSDQHIN